MADINENYMMLYTLQQYFVDKVTGEPLANGEIRFYKDYARNEAKDVFKWDHINGYVNIGSTVTLSAVGTPVDENGTDIAIYILPYQDDSGATVELYYIDVVNSSGVTQLTRDEIPNLSANPDSSFDTYINYIPNGQFLLHNNLPATDTEAEGEVREAVTTVAPGGWTFNRDPASTSANFITFPDYEAYTDRPSGNPRFSIKLILATDDANKLRGLRIKFPNASKFAGSDKFTFSFFGVSNTTTLSNVKLLLIRNFGTGGSPDDEETTTIDANIAINEDGGIYYKTFTFGTTEGKIFGTNNDDYLQLELQFPSASSVNVNLTDFLLTPGEQVISQFPSTSDAKFIADSLAGWTKVPDYNGDDLYLPLVLTPSGLTFSRADIGKICPAIYATANIGELLCDGTQYETNDYSDDGIPYSRLHDVVYDATAKVPAFGTGLNFATAYIEETNTDRMILAVNQQGTASIPAPGTSGFTVTQIHATSSTNFGVRAFQYASNGLIVISTVVGFRTDSTSSATGFTVTNTRDKAATFHVLTLETGPASGLINTAIESSYLTIITSVDTYIIWFQIGASTIPSATGTKVEVKLQGDETAADIALILKHVLTDCQVYSLTVTDASTITGGNYFTFGTTGSNEYYAWYKKAGVGSNPNVNGKIGIEVDIGASDTAADVADKTRIAINQKYYAVPDFRGMTLRGYDATGIWDIDTATRWGMVGGVYGARLGTFQLDQLLQHNHPGSTLIFNTSGSTATTIGLAQKNTTPDTFPVVVVAPDGGSENRVVNANVNYYIKY